jgi:hypothetical protein
LPIRLTLPGDDRPTLRTYSISSAPEAQHYRLSIKRAGRFSGHMHAIGAPGTRIEAKPPSGQFTIDATAARPAVLLAGGIGVTPLLAMAHHLVSWRRRTRRMRPTWLFQAARRRQELAFQSEIAALVLESAGALRHLRVLSDPKGAEQGRDYDVAGRVDLALLKRSLPWDDYDFVLCGPPAFMQAIHDGLRAMSVRDARIHAEAFGPASLVRQADADSVEPSLPPAARDAVSVRFAAADREALWTPEAGSLLDLAEAIGLAPPFSCRGGSCGSCRTALIAGEATYATTPNYRTQPGEILLC